MYEKDFITPMTGGIPRSALNQSHPAIILSASFFIVGSLEAPSRPKG